jgi:heme A synthase
MYAGGTRGRAMNREVVNTALRVLLAIFIGLLACGVIFYLTGTPVFMGLAFIIGFSITLIKLWPKKDKISDNPPDEPAEEEHP